MDLLALLNNSLVLQNWQIVCVAILLIILVNIYPRALTRYAELFKKYDGEKQHLHGEEDVCAVNFTTGTQDDDDYSPALEDKAHVPYNGATVTLPDGAAQFYAMASNRRSVRAFNRQPVDIAVIENCIRAAGTAPSGAHTEPWTFCVISDAELKQNVRRIVETEEQLNYAQRMHRQWTADLRPLRTDHIKEYLTDAPYLVLVFKQVYGLTVDGRRRQHYYNEISVAIAIGIFLCAVQAAGLSTLVTTPLNCGPALRALMGRPANEKLLALLPVGYAALNCLIPDLKRKDLNQIMIKY